MDAPEQILSELRESMNSFLRQFQEFSKSGVGKLRYRLKGTAFVESPGSFKLPFDEKGEVDLVLPASREGS